MAEFGVDFADFIGLAMEASYLRVRQQIRSEEADALLHWQEELTNELRTDGSRTDLQTAWDKLREEAKRAADLLHDEVRLIGGRLKAVLGPFHQGAPVPIRKRFSLKRALEHAKTLLESILDILGDLLPRGAKALVRMFIEALSFVLSIF